MPQGSASVRDPSNRLKGHDPLARGSSHTDAHRPGCRSVRRGIERVLTADIETDCRVPAMRRRPLCHAILGCGGRVPDSLRDTDPPQVKQKQKYNSPNLRSLWLRAVLSLNADSRMRATRMPTEEMVRIRLHWSRPLKRLKTTLCSQAVPCMSVAELINNAKKNETSIQ